VYITTWLCVGSNVLSEPLKVLKNYD